MPDAKIMSFYPIQHNNRDFGKSNQKADRLYIHLEGRMEVVPIQSIVFISSESNYCRIFKDDGSYVFHSKTLARYESALKTHGFIRVHHSYLINLSKVESIDKRLGLIQLNSNYQVPYSRSRKKEIFRYFHSFAKI